MPNLKAVREDLDNGDLAGAASDFGSSCDRWSTADLVELHNDLAPKKVKAWKKSKLLLIAKIDDMLLAMAEGKMPHIEVEDADGNVSKVDVEPGESISEAVVKAVKKVMAKSEKKPSVCSVLRDQLANGLEIDLKQFAEQHHTSMASVRCYLSYIRKGMRGAEQLNLVVKNGIAVKA